MVWAPDPAAVGKPIDQLDTPCLLLDLDKVERNLDTMASAFAGTPVRLRPHAKTHKTPVIALMQLQRGAVGICCAKLGEAEVMAAGGVSGILLTSEIVGPAKIQRLIGLTRYANVITVVDDEHAAMAISEAALAADVRVQCLVDLDVGTHRTGVAPGDAALGLAQHVDRMAGLELVGLQGYEGHVQHIVDEQERGGAHSTAAEMLSHTAGLLLEHGLNVTIVSTGGTGTYSLAGRWPRITEVQAGSYVVMDTHYGSVQGVRFEHALTVLAGVISTRHNGVLVDAGFKALSTDSGPAAPKDLVAQYVPFGDEHGLLRFDDGGPLSLGDKIELIPSHCDTTINLHDLYYVTRGGYVVAVWPIAARGRIR